jgi:hypothetical protein
VSFVQNCHPVTPPPPRRRRRRHYQWRWLPWVKYNTKVSSHGLYGRWRRSWTTTKIWW